MDWQVQETGSPVSFDSPSSNDYKIPSERTTLEFRCFFVHRWFVLFLFLRDCRSVHSGVDGWSLKPRQSAPVQLIKVTASNELFYTHTMANK